MGKLNKISIVLGIVSLSVIIGAVTYSNTGRGELTQAIDGKNDNVTYQTINMDGTEYIELAMVRDFNIQYQISEDNKLIVLTRDKDKTSVMMEVGKNLMQFSNSDAPTMDLGRPVLEKSGKIFIPKNAIDKYLNLEDSKIVVKEDNLPIEIRQVYVKLEEAVKSFATSIDMLSNSGPNVVAISVSGEMEKEEYLELRKSYDSLLVAISDIRIEQETDISIIKECMISTISYMIKVHEAYIGGLSSDIAENKKMVIMQWERLNSLIVID